MSPCRILPLILGTVVAACATATPPGGAPAASPAAIPQAVPSGAQSFTTPKGLAVTALDSGEIDSYEKPGAGLSSTGDQFEGTDRKASKLAIASAPLERFGSVQELIDSLEPDEDMVNRQPPISRAPTSRRVSEERRNVSVDSVLVAASREDDNDFHLIVCDDPDASPDDQHCLNVEVSGLPAGGSHKARLREARNQFQALVSSQLPGQSYKFYKPPIPVTVSGSLFFDISHTAGAVGPKKARPQTAWEIHPVTEIVERTP